MDQQNGGVADQWGGGTWVGGKAPRSGPAEPAYFNLKPISRIGNLFVTCSKPKTMIRNPSFGSALLTVRRLTLGEISFLGVTGGVYKLRERIHRALRSGPAEPACAPRTLPAGSTAHAHPDGAALRRARSLQTPATAPIPSKKVRDHQVFRV
jgi:hypothetical protein